MGLKKELGLTPPPLVDNVPFFYRFFYRRASLSDDGDLSLVMKTCDVCDDGIGTYHHDYHDMIPSLRLVFSVLLITFALVASVYLVDYKQGQLAK